MKTYNFGGKIVEAVGVHYRKSMNACKGCAFFVDGVATCADYKIDGDENITACFICNTLSDSMSYPNLNQFKEVKR